jgi:hypothetical protein
MGHRMTRLAYILAASHSGSTLLAMLLGRHPEICTVGELKATRLGDPARYRCSCGREIRRCPFWLDVRDEMARRGYAYEVTAARTDVTVGMTPYVTRLLRPLHRGPALEAVRDAALALSPTWRRELPRIQAVNAALAQVLCERTGKKLVVDSSKIGVRLKYLLRNPALDVRVLRLVRDGRGVALTYTDPAQFADAQNPALKGGGMGGDRREDRLPMSAAAREWRRSNEEAEAVLRGLDRSRWFEVRYEDLCSAPESTLKNVLAFLGMNPDRTALDFRSVEHHVVGNGMRLDSGQEIRVDERWKTALNSADLRTFSLVAGDLNRRLGYA